MSKACFAYHYYYLCKGSRPKAIDPYGYHLVGCEIGANAIRLHDEVVAMVAKLFRTLRLDAISKLLLKNKFDTS